MQSDKILSKVTEANEAYRFARRERDRLIRWAVFRGRPRNEIAKASGLSKPRVDQIARGVRAGYPETLDAKTD